MEPTATSRTMARRDLLLLLAAMLVPVLVLRLTLHASPDLDLDVAGHNVPHLFTGLLLVSLGGIPLALLRREGPWRRPALAAFGGGLGLALDEWVYLIVTDGSNASYLLPVSLWGAVVVLGLASAYALLLALRDGRSGGRPAN